MGDENSQLVLTHGKEVSLATQEGATHTSDFLGRDLESASDTIVGGLWVQSRHVLAVGLVQ